MRSTPVFGYSADRVLGRPGMPSLREKVRLARFGLLSPSNMTCCTTISVNRSCIEMKPCSAVLGACPLGPVSRIYALPKNSGGGFS